ncbi:MAG: GIY-YIG nuclease family protein [Gammaproteobacteria bacterium]
MKIKVCDQPAGSACAGDPWQVYILECSDGSFYTGITKQLERRLQQHNSGRASRCTRSRLPVKVIYHEQCTGRSQALSREMAIKTLTRTAKQKLVANGAPEA